MSAVGWMFFDERGNAFAAYESRTEAHAALSSFSVDDGPFVMIGYDSAGTAVEAFTGEDPDSEVLE